MKLKLIQVAPSGLLMVPTSDLTLEKWKFFSGQVTLSDSEFCPESEYGIFRSARPSYSQPSFWAGREEARAPEAVIAHAAIFPISVFLCHVIRFLPRFEHGPF